MKCLILGYLFLDLFYSILDGGVVLTAEYDADCLQRGLGKSPHQIHGDLPRNRDAGASLVALKVGDRNIEMIRYNIKDQFGGYFSVIVRRYDILLNVNNIVDNL